MSHNFDPFKKQLISVENWLKKEFQQIRTGQASPQVLDTVTVEIYGAPMHIKELASITIEGARTLRISPWEKGQSKDIEKAISISNLGLSVVVDDQGLRVNFPELTSERRKDIVKIAKDKLEDAKKQVRQHRDTVVKYIQTKEKDGALGKDDAFRIKNDAQKMVDNTNKVLEDLFKAKEKEILG